MRSGNMKASLLIYIAMIIIPLGFIWFMIKNMDKLDTPEFRTKYGALYSEITVHTRGKYTILYLPLFFLRRWITILIPVIFQGYIAFQIISLLFVNKFTVIIYGELKSHDSHNRRILEYYNDSLTMCSTYAILSMTAFNQS